MLVKAGSTDVTTYFHMRLAADGTDATGLSPTNFDLTYVRTRAEPAAKVDASALTDQDDAHADNSVIEVDGTNMPGVYRVDWPDAAFAANAPEVVLTVKCATAFTESLRVQLTGFDPTDGVRAGLTALPNAAAGAAGGLPTDSTGKTAFNDLSAAGVRSAVGLGSANLDTQLGDLPTNSELATALDAIPTADENAAELLDFTNGVEGSLTVRQHMRLSAAVLYGKASGLETTEATYRNPGDTINRVVATVDTNGNRTAVTTDAS